MASLTVLRWVTGAARSVAPPFSPDAGAVRRSANHGG